MVGKWLAREYRLISFRRDGEEEEVDPGDKVLRASPQTVELCCDIGPCCQIKPGAEAYRVAGWSRLGSDASEAFRQRNPRQRQNVLQI